MALYKHLVYVDFINFIRQSSSPPYYMEMLVFKHIQCRFHFSKTEDFMLQRLISENIQETASKCAI